MTILTQGQFYTQMRDYMIANQDKITDFNVGTALDTQFKAMSIQLNQALVKASGGFKSQFEQIPFQAFDYERKDALYSGGTVVFSRPTADLVDLTIPIGTIVGTSTGLLYTTQNEVTILSGNTDSGAATITANLPGEKYDVQAGVINIINSSVPGVSSVTNNTGTSGGRDKETNAEYFTRFQNFILGLDGCSRYGIFTAAVTTSTIQSAYVQDHFPPDSGIYNFTVYVDDGSGAVPSTKLDEIYLKIYGNDSYDSQGYAAAGINFRVLTAGRVNIEVVYTIQIDLNSTNATTITTTVSNAITNYINSLWVGSDVLISEVNRLIKGISGILNVTNLTLNGSAADVTIASSQVPRVNTITPTVTG